MLTDKQITQVEGLFLAIDSKKINHLIDEIIEKVFIISGEQGQYLLWLLNRWIILRNHPYHLPTRIV